MAWIESHQTLGRHPKLIRLAEALGIHRAQAVGHLHYLWWWALDFAQDGDLSGFTDEEIEEAAQWNGVTRTFAQALREHHFIDENNTLHDWHDYIGKLIKIREHARERMRSYRKRYAKAKPLRERSSNVTRTLRSTQPNPTQPIEANASCASHRFKAPTPEEADSYAEEIGLPQPERVKFLSHYGSNGWKVGRNPMKDWKCAMRGWLARLEDKPNVNVNGGQLPLWKQLDGLKAESTRLSDQLRQAPYDKAGPQRDELLARKRAVDQRIQQVQTA